MGRRGSIVVAGLVLLRIRTRIGRSKGFCFTVMAGRVPAICAPAVEAWVAGTRPAMTVATEAARQNPSPHYAFRARPGHDDVVDAPRYDRAPSARPVSHSVTAKPASIGTTNSNARGLETQPSSAGPG